jgi:hypothetical protein
MAKMHWRLLGKVGIAGWGLAISPGSYLRSVGWLKSINTQQSVDALGNPVPWFTYAANTFLGTRQLDSLAVFEYGCGSSTLWLAERVASVHSVEHNYVWYDRMKKLLPPNVTLTLAIAGYVENILVSNTPYDLIIVDGIDRIACCEAATKALSAHGVVILDNSERVEYAPAITSLQAKGFRRLDFAGLTPISNIGSCTSFFYRDGNCLGI